MEYFFNRYNSRTQSSKRIRNDKRKQIMYIEKIYTAPPPSFKYNTSFK